MVQEVVKNPLIICRIYACIADILGYMSEEVGIRGGPAANVAWKSAFSLLEKENYLAATRALAAERQTWIEGCVCVLGLILNVYSTQQVYTCS